MAQDLEIAVDKIIGLLTQEFTTYNTEDTPISKETAKFWKRLSKRLPEIAAQFEKEPTANSDALKQQMIEIGDKDRVKMNYVMYLYSKDTPIK